MVKGVGKAFEKALSPAGKKGEKDDERHVFMLEFGNKNRRDIFSYLCLHPGSHVSIISEALGLSLHTAGWHVRKLIEKDYVSKYKFGKKTVFYPSDMIHPKDIPIFDILNNEKAKAIYHAILDSAGKNQGEICKSLGLNHQAVIWYTKRMASLGLITSVSDGRFRRYYPTDLLKRKRDENAARINKFRDNLVKRLRREMLSPEVLRSTEDRLVVKIKGGGNRAVLTLHTDPFVTVLM